MKIYSIQVKQKLLALISMNNDCLTTDETGRGSYILAVVSDGIFGKFE